MLTKYKLHIGEEEYELKEDDLRNWDDIKVSYKRSDLDGVVRSFSSQFEFVNEAKRLLWEAYLRDGVNTVATLSVYVITNEWVWEKRFESPLDFSTLQVENYTLKLNAVDNSLAALIKANKGTKYEFVVGEDIKCSTDFLYDRLPMIETATYKFSNGTSYEDSQNIFVRFRGAIPWVGNVGSEICVNGAVHFLDDQEDTEGSYALKAYKDVNVSCNFMFTYLNGKGAGATWINVRVRRGGELLDMDSTTGGMVCALSNDKIHVFPDIVFTANNLPSIQEIRAELQRLGFDTSVSNNMLNAFILCNDGVWRMEYATWLPDNYQWVATYQSLEEYTTTTTSGSLKLELKEGDEVVIMTDVDSNCSFMFVDSQMVFSWNATGQNVIIKTIKPQTVLDALIERMTDGKPITASISNYSPLFAQTYLLAAESIRDIKGAKFYSSFDEFCNWMATAFGYTYVVEIDRNNKESIMFLHRSELYNGEGALKKIDNSSEVQYSVDSSLLYSTVTIGYDKKDYNSTNGREEFNFNNTYTTGCTVSDKTLSLLSKYRADCYGIEFAAQKRNADTTDNDSDQDVFFVACKTSAGRLIPARSAKIEGVMSDKVFNGEFSPMACVIANAGFIGIQSDPLKLSFASSTANADITIDGIKMNSDLQLEDSYATPGVVEFTTDNVDDIADVDELVEVTDSEGVTYRGFLKEVDISYTKEEAAKYKLIVKEIVP